MIAAKLDGNIVINTIVVDEIPEGYVACPEWVGIGMDIDTPEPIIIEPVLSPVEKLKEFLSQNPDVANILV